MTNFQSPPFCNPVRAAGGKIFKESIQFLDSFQALSPSVVCSSFWEFSRESSSSRISISLRIYFLFAVYLSSYLYIFISASTVICTIFLSVIVCRVVSCYIIAISFIVQHNCYIFFYLPVTVYVPQRVLCLSLRILLSVNSSWTSLYIYSNIILICRHINISLWYPISCASLKKSFRLLLAEDNFQPAASSVAISFSVEAAWRIFHCSFVFSSSFQIRAGTCDAISTQFAYPTNRKESPDANAFRTALM